MRIAVVGGAGSIGSALVNRLIELGHEVCVFDFDEYGLYRLAVAGVNARMICGDVSRMSDLQALEAWRPEVIYNCAAIKHITFCEDNPKVAYRVNAEGCSNLSVTHAKLILLSTDKAVEPTSELGTSKQYAERIVLYSHNPGVVVRLCNVWDTRGSFFETAEAQVLEGRPITITQRGVTRWYMDKDAAVDLLVAAIAQPPGTVMIPTEPVVSLINIAQTIEARYPGHPIVEVGLREGEKLHEALMWDDEEVLRTALGYCVVRRAPAQSTTGTQPPALPETAG